MSAGWRWFSLFLYLRGHGLGVNSVFFNISWAFPFSELFSPPLSFRKNNNNNDNHSTSGALLLFFSDESGTNETFMTHRGDQAVF